MSTENSFVFPYSLNADDTKNLKKKIYLNGFLFKPLMSGVTAAVFFYSLTPANLLMQIKIWLQAYMPNVDISTSLIAVIGWFLVGILTTYSLILFRYVKIKIRNGQTDTKNKIVSSELTFNQEYLKLTVNGKNIILGWDTLARLQFKTNKNFLIISAANKDKFKPIAFIPLRALEENKLTVQDFMRKIQANIPSKFSLTDLSNINNQIYILTNS